MPRGQATAFRLGLEKRRADEVLEWRTFAAAHESAFGPTPTTWAVQQVVGYLGYPGRGADVTGTVAPDPIRPWASFEACSAFTRVTACTLALSPIRDTLSEGFSYFVTSTAAPAASGWSVRRVGLAPTGKRRLVTAHAISGHSRRAVPLVDFEYSSSGSVCGLG